jgi:hypothetical protein
MKYDLRAPQPARTHRIQPILAQLGPQFLKQSSQNGPATLISVRRANFEGVKNKRNEKEQGKKMQRHCLGVLVVIITPLAIC